MSNTANHIEHFYQPFQGWFDFLDVYAGVVAAAPETGAKFVEVGCWLGKSTIAMAVEILNSGKSIRFDVVDHFKGSDDFPKAIVPLNIREVFERNISSVRHAVHDIHECLSWRAASRYADNSLDFVFIDASHDMESVSKDLAAWWPKVRSGGLFAGHDYDQPGVQSALDEWAYHSGVSVERVSRRCWQVAKGRG